MSDSKLRVAILELGKFGCQGNIQDFGHWLLYNGDQSIADEAVPGTLDTLVQDGIFKTHPDIPSEYLLAEPLSFPERVEYKVSGNLKNSPIQMVRSRLEAFLQFHGATEEAIMDISIGVTEAMENAVKYSDHKIIEIYYEIKGGDFHIRVTNRIGEIMLERDIDTGKYNGTGTLMRGMMVMDKLFDEFMIDLQEDQNLAIFSASKKL